MIQAALTNSPYQEFFRPLVKGWTGKLETAHRARSKWLEIANECKMFYSKSAAAMWDPSYSRKFWVNVRAPRFRITINKAFEMVAIYGPNLLWEVPHRNVQPKKSLEIPEELFQQDEQAMQFYQMLQQQQGMNEARSRLTAFLMQSWLNYTPMEQPGGGLMGHSELAVIDSLVTGRGCMWSRPYQFPSSGRTLTGTFREPPERLYIDPDFKSIHEAKWIALQHIDPHWEVERRFQQPAGSLKGRASLESSWHYSETNTLANGPNMHRVAGQTNDLLVWYEIWSKTGPGGRMTGMPEGLKQHLEETVGDYAYLAIAPSVPYPLNCSSSEVRGGLSNEQVRKKFEWPVPFWADDRWPVEVLDHYPDPDNSWPIAPLAPGLGELKFLNFLIPWLANRIYSSSRDFWSVAGPHFNHYVRYLEEGGDQTIIPTPNRVDDVRKAINVLQQPETRLDAWRIIELVSEQFDKATGLTEFQYGRNEKGTQDRTAETTIQRARQAGVRSEHMQKKVVSWQSNIAIKEAFVTRWFVTGEDIEDLLGPVARFLWEQYVMTSNVELVVREMEYSIAAASIRRPNRDRDIANFQQVLSIFAPVIQQYAAQSGDYQPFNQIMNQWGDLHDMDLERVMIPPPQPDPSQEQAQQMEQMKMMLELQKIQAQLQGQQMNVQGKQLDMQAKQLITALDQAKRRQDMRLDQTDHAQKMYRDLQTHVQELGQDQDVHEQDFSQKQAMNRLDLRQAKAMNTLKLRQARQPMPNGRSAA